MRNRKLLPPDRRVERIAGRQYGVITRDQARSAGLSDRAIDLRLVTRKWERMYQGVCRLPVAQLSWHQALMAAWLWVGDRAVVSHRSAGALWELDGVEPGAIELTVPKRTKSHDKKVTVHVRPVPDDHVVRIGKFIVTRVSRTLFDLAGVVGESIAERALDDALRRKLTSFERLCALADAFGTLGRGGTKAFRKLLAVRDPSTVPPESVLEARLIRILTAAGLPQPVRQYNVRDERGQILARVDLAYPDLLVAIEADGYRYHSGKADWQRDLKRRNFLTSRGWRVLHVTWEDVMTNKAIGDEVRRALSAL